MAQGLFPRRMRSLALRHVVGESLRAQRRRARDDDASYVADLSGHRAGSHAATGPMSITVRLVAQLVPIVSRAR